MTEDEMVGWHHPLDGHESEQAPGVGDGQGGLVCCSPWGYKELDMTEQTEEKQQQNVILVTVCLAFFTPMPTLVLVDS